MKKEIPEINFDQNTKLDIEVRSFREFFSKLKKTKDHNPFTSHKIKFYLILLVTKNTYTHFVDFKSYELKEGSTLFIAKNQVHHFNIELQQTEGYAIIFNHLFIDKHYFLTDNIRLNRLFNYHIESPVIHQKDIGDNDLTDVIHYLYEEYISEIKFAKSEILASLLRVLLLKAEREKEYLADSNITTNKRWLEIFSEFRNMLEIEYVNTRSSRFFAARLFVSYKFLNDVVKKMSGKTAKAFIDDFVIVEIKRYLISTSLSIKEISYETGFEEPANMIKFFKKKTATTPLKYRHQL